MRTVRIFHQYGEPTHFVGLKALHRTRIESYTLDPFFLVYRRLRRPKHSGLIFAGLLDILHGFWISADRPADAVIIALPPTHVMFGLLAVLVPRAPVQVYFTSYSEWRTERRWWVRAAVWINAHFVAWLCTNVAAVNMASYQAMRALRPCVLVEHAVSDVPRQRTNPPARIDEVLYIGRVVPYKRLEAAIAGCRCAGVKLTIAGDALDDAYRAKLVELGGGEVRWLGKMPKTWIIENLCTFDAVILISEAREPFGLVLIESLLASVPVIATRTAGTETIFRDWGDYPLLIDGQGDISAEIAAVVKTYNTSSDVWRDALAERSKGLASRYTGAARSEHWNALLPVDASCSI